VQAFREPLRVGWHGHDGLLVERVLHDSTRPSLADAEDRGRRESVRLDTAAIVREPLYLLQAYAAVQNHQSEVWLQPADQMKLRGVGVGVSSTAA
jgi:hypothetical protein